MLSLSACPALCAGDTDPYFRISRIEEDSVRVHVRLPDSGSSGISINSPCVGTTEDLARCLAFTLMAGVRQRGFVSVDWGDIREMLEDCSVGALALFPILSLAEGKAAVKHSFPLCFRPSRVIASLVGGRSRRVEIADIAQAFELGDALCGTPANVICVAPDRYAAAPFAAILALGNIQ